MVTPEVDEPGVPSRRGPPWGWTLIAVGIAASVVWLPLPGWGGDARAVGTVVHRIWWDAVSLVWLLSLVGPGAGARWGAAKDNLRLPLQATALALLTYHAIVVVTPLVVRSGLHRGVGVSGLPVIVPATLVGAACVVLLMGRLADRGPGPGLGWVFPALAVASHLPTVAGELAESPQGLAPLVAGVGVFGVAGLRFARAGGPRAGDAPWSGGGLGYLDPWTEFLLRAASVFGIPISAYRDTGPVRYALVVAGSVMLAMWLRPTPAIVAAEARYEPGIRASALSAAGAASATGRGRVLVLTLGSFALYQLLTSLGVTGAGLALVAWAGWLGAMVAEVSAAHATPGCVVPVWCTHKVYEGEPARAFLMRAGVPCVARGLGVRTVSPLSLFIPITLLVRLEDAERARALLATVPPPDVRPPEAPPIRLAPTSGDNIWSGPTRE